MQKSNLAEIIKNSYDGYIFPTKVLVTEFVTLIDYQNALRLKHDFSPIDYERIIYLISYIEHRTFIKNINTTLHEFMLNCSIWHFSLYVFLL